MDRVKFIAQKRTTLKTKLTLWQNAYTQGRIDKVGLKVRFDRLTELFRAYEELHDELAILEPGNEILNETEEIGDRYYEIARLMENMSGAGPSTAPTGNVSFASSTMIEKQRRAKLPVTEIPKFDGNIQNWLSYKNSFLQMIDARPDISELEKFIYLKDSLKGEALNKISVLDVSADNYKLAWELLKENYERKRIIVHKHFDCILDLPKVTKPTYKGLSKLVDDVRQHINVLKTLDVVVDENIVVRVIERALPSETRDKWEDKFTLNTLPTLDQLFKFISETAFKILTQEQEQARMKPETGFKRSNSSADTRPGKVRRDQSGTRVFVTSTSNNCAHCKQSSHYLYSCPAFGKLSVAQRWNVVKANKVCRNCLRLHKGTCKSIRCKHCGSFHHSMLHYFKTNTPDTKEDLATNPQPESDKGQDSRHEQR